MTVVIGLDPGQVSGGVAVLYNQGLPLEDDIHVFPMPAIESLADYLDDHEGAHVFIEKAQSFPKQGVSSSFNYGRHFGELLGVICALKLKHTLVPPRTWSKVIHAGTRADDTKARSVEACRRLFPGVDLVPEGSRAKKPHLGMVEALLIAEYGRRVLGASA